MAPRQHMDLSMVLVNCKGGNELAWEELVRRFQARIHGIAYHYTGNTEDAREITQEVFVKVYRNLDAWPEAELFFPWLYCISRNACIDHLRRLKARPPAHDVPADKAFLQGPTGDDPEQQSMARSRQQLICSGLQKLSRLNRQLILLKELKGLSLAQIASALKIPLGTVKSRSNRARIELAQKLVELGHS
jgi:RNA polymerase sigma-70 factor (ECF subfamily)